MHKLPQSGRVHRVEVHASVVVWYDENGCSQGGSAFDRVEKTARHGAGREDDPSEGMERGITEKMSWGPK